MKKRWTCLALVVIMTFVFVVPAIPIVSADGPFSGKYEQVMGPLWDTDDNTITFNSDNTFSISANMYEGFYDFTGSYTVSGNQAFCTITGGDYLSGKTFTMTNINGNLAFESDTQIQTIKSGALFKDVTKMTNAEYTPMLAWEDSYLQLIKNAKSENGSFSFALYDIDENGTPELFLGSYGFYTIYTYTNGQCVDLGTCNDRLYKWPEKNSFITYGGMGTGLAGATMFKLENGQLSEGEFIFASEWDEGATSGKFYWNGQDVSEDTYNSETKKYINLSNSIYEFFVAQYDYVPNETRLSDYVTSHGSVASSPEINVLLDGKKISFDQPPIKDNDRTLVPMRAIFEAMGATVTWNNSTQTVTATKNGITITMQIGYPNININGKTVTLDVPPKVVNDRTLVPVRAVAEGLSAGVDWEESTQTVYITSDFYNFTVNNFVKNKAYFVFSNPTTDDGYKTWEFNNKDDLNMTDKEYKDYVYATSVGAALVETGADLADFDFADLFGNNNEKEYIEDSIKRLLAPTEDELKTMLQKNLEGIKDAQEKSNDVISICDNVIEIYKEYKGKDFDFNRMIKDVGGKATDFGLTVSLDTVNDTLADLILIKTISDTYDIVGDNYEQFINDLSSSNNASQDKDLIVQISKEVLAKQKASTKNQIISAMKSAAVDNTLKEAIKTFIKSSLSPNKIESLGASIYLTVFKFFANDFIEGSNSWLAFAGMNSIQKLAATEYETLLAQAKVDKMPVSADLQNKLKNAALVYIMSSIKCRDLLLDTVDKSHTGKDITPLKNKLETRNNLAYQAFSAWKNAGVIEY